MLRSRLQWKVLINFGILIVIITAMTILTATLVRDIGSDFKAAADDTQFILEIERVQYDISELPILADDYARFGELSVRLQYERRLREAIFRMRHLTEIAGDSSTVALLKDAQKNLRKWSDESGSTRIKQGDLVIAGGELLDEDPSAHSGSISDFYLDHTRNTLRQIFREKTASHHTSIDNAASLSEKIPVYIYIVNILIVVFAIVLGAVLTRSIIKPLNQLNESTGKISDGTFKPLAINRKDEFGDLADNFNRMSMLVYSQYKSLKHYSELVSNLNATKNIKHLAAQSLSHLCTHTGAYAGSIYLLDRKTNRLNRVNSLGFDLQSSTVHSVHIGEGLIGHCAAASERTEQVFGAGADINIPGLPLIESCRVYCVPLEYRNNTIGVVILASKERLEYHIIHQALPQVAIAITNARHYEEIQNLSLEIGGRNKELEKTVKNNREFLAFISHEIRTPLNAVIGYSAALLERGTESLDDDQRLAMQKISNNGKLLLELTDNLIDISKLEENKMPVIVTIDSVRSVLSQSIQVIEPLLKTKNIRLIKRVQQGLTDLETDTLKMRQSLINLIGNAVKYSDEGDIIITVSRHEENIKFEIDDPGIGIAEEHREIIFDAYQRIDSDMPMKYQGAGLGLTISRKMARLLGGDITVVSEPGRGSIFTLIIPAVFDSKNGQGSLSMPSEDRQSGRITVFQKTQIK